MVDTENHCWRWWCAGLLMPTAKTTCHFCVVSCGMFKFSLLSACDVRERNRQGTQLQLVQLFLQDVAWLPAGPTVC
jgi:hypothetical protein